MVAKASPLAPEAPCPSWSEDPLTQALDDVTDSFFLLSSDWTIQHVNARFERNLHRSRAEFVGRNLWEAVPGMVGTPFESEMRLAMEGAAPRVFEIYSQSLGCGCSPGRFPARVDSRY